MSIFKETFKEGVRNQLDIRQKAIKNRTPQNLTYYNSRNAWIRMTSSVNVGGDGGKLAKSYILQGGVLNPNGKLRSGLGQDGSYSNISPGGKPYYGAATTATAGTAGIKPMPGITNIDVKSLGAYGSLREVTVNFNAWNIQQLEELELLYMRPGYSVLIEWGWAPYLDNNGNLSNTISYTDDVLKGGKTKEEIWKTIQTKAKENGNYDAMYGFIKNYSWSARPDGGYDCTVTVVSMGEIIESLKINYSPVASKAIKEGMFTEDAGSRPFDKENPIAKAYSQNLLAGICTEMYEIVIKQLTNNNSEKNITLTSREGRGSDTYTFCRYDIAISNAEEKKDTFLERKEQIYITLRDLCKLLNKYVLLQDNNNNPIASVSTQEGNHYSNPGADLLCLADIYQISTNPAVCQIKNDAWINAKTNLGIDGVKGPIINLMKGLTTNYWHNEKFSVTSEDNGIPCLGVIGNIFVNLGYIYSLVSSDDISSQDKNEKKEIPLYDFLKNLVSGISTAIGNVANLDLFSDPEDSVLRIIDVNYADDRNRQKAYEDSFILQMHNLNSTVRSYKLESKIFPAQSSMVAIGAQVKGGALGTNTNTLVDFNQNLEDRIVKERIDPTTKANEQDNTATLEAKINTLKDNISVIVSYLNAMDSSWYEFIIGDGVGDFDVNKSSTYSSALRDIINFKKDLVIDDNKNRSIIPTALSLEMDGIGGIIIGNMFRIPNDLLPRGYKGDGAGPARIVYLVTRLGHSIQNNDWITKIDAQFTVLDEPKRGVDGETYKKIISVIESAQKDETQTQAIEKAKEIITSPPPPPSSKNVNTGGTTKTINGKVYKNGQVEELLVSIRPDLYNRHWSPVCQSDNRRIRLQANAIQNLEKLLTDAWKEGIHIKVNSAYRTYDDQVRVKQASAKSGIPAATPGRSNHGFGLAVDLANANGTRINPNKTPKEWAWVQANKYKYSYENINNVNESHHYNFIG
jgi:LAS superfamily LD-carboxypeptidase LdcB